MDEDRLHNHRKGIRLQCYTCRHMALDYTKEPPGRRDMLVCTKGCEVFTPAKKLCDEWEATPKPVLDGLAWCVNCERLLLDVAFFRNSRYKRGVQSTCKVCHYEAEKASRGNRKRHKGM